MTGLAAPAAIPAGLQVLVVEDEIMLAVLVEDMLTSFGCRVVKAPRIEQALQLVAATAFDLALLDVNVAGRPVYPVAQALDRRGIPFAFVTGYGAVQADYRDRPTLGKPYNISQLRRILAATIGRRAPDAGA